MGVEMQQRFSELELKDGENCNKAGIISTQK
ncbi:hypothetical protein NVIRENTERO_00564 [Sodalis praecaptivus]|nr:hypothetical protein NVIRENTERO_00564 [Sodalis praecaptivus]